jgi:hypothetical protein
MRHVSVLLLLPTLIAPAFANDPPNPKAHAARQTWEQHFAQANLAHDSHLTQAEAKGGYALIATHFNDIDMEHKGFVTENDIRTWQAMRKAARKLAHAPADRLKPQHAFQLRPPVQPLAPTVQAASVPARVPVAARATPIGE